MGPFWKSQIILKAYEHIVLKFDRAVVLVLYHFEYKTPKNGVIFVKKKKLMDPWGSPRPSSNIRVNPVPWMNWV